MPIDEVLSEIGVKRDAVKQHDHFIHAETAYQLIDSAARSAKDRYLGVHVGEAMDFTKIALFFEAVKEAQTLGEFFVRYLAQIPGAASSVQHTLNINGAVAEFETHRRIRKPKNSPAQSDGFGLSYIVRLFEAFSSTTWVPSQVTVKANHVEAIPPNYKGMHLVKDPTVTLRISFPSEWLLRRLQMNSVLTTREHDAPKYDGNIQSTTGAIRLLLEGCDLAVEVRAELIARQLGVTERSLRRRLILEGTTLTREINSYKLESAQFALANGNAKVAEISAQLGYSTTANFSRFFKTETGVSPRQYRNINSFDSG
ncbi:helix-turn-helix domain-containing protein [Tateyamaria sp.]|uniref:AraC family transcriptional regulator n=1 Tax=Tateyamaria sp. TaxID=1929288 RepID=UPI00329D5534